MLGKAFIFSLFLIFSILFLQNIWEYPGNYFSDTIIDNHKIKFERDSETGIISYYGDDDLDFIRGIGYIHAQDRFIQLLLQRSIGKGELSKINNSNNSLVIDKIMRKMNFVGSSRNLLSSLSDSQKELLKAYSSGINTYINNQWFHGLEFLLSPLSKELWTEEDTLVTMHLLSFAGLITLQSDAEQFIIQSINKGKIITINQLNDLFPNQLEGLDKELIKYIRRLVEFPTVVSKDQFIGIPYLEDIVGSNNWVISGNHTESGFPIQANDPHLQVNRLPSIFYEFKYIQGNKFSFGVSVPGIPGLVMGRTNKISYGFTYGVMDQFDYYIEHVENGQVLRPNNKYIPLIQREEIIYRKGDEPYKAYYYSTEDGTTLELINNYNSKESIPNGYYLAFKWAWNAVTGSRLTSLQSHIHVENVDEMASILRSGGLSCNYLISDIHNNIAYQQSGVFPIRKHNHSHILPVLAWKENAIWDSIYPPEDLIYVKNPPEGYIVTANHQVLNIKPDHPLDSISIHMGPYRQQRGVNMIKEKLDSNNKLSIEYMKEMQLDLYALQAEYLMPILKPLLPPSPLAQELRNWDYKFKSNSRGALLYQTLYTNIVGEMAGYILNNKNAGIYLMQNTTMKRVLYHYFDGVLLAGNKTDNSLLFGYEGKEKFLRRISNEILGSIDKNHWIHNKNNNYGNIYKPITYSNLFWSKIISLFDYGPYIQEGHSTVLMVGDYRKDKNNEFNSAASWRYITDMINTKTYTVIPGGTSGNWWSKNYANELKNLYIKNKYKIIEH